MVNKLIIILLFVPVLLFGNSRTYVHFIGDSNTAGVAINCDYPQYVTASGWSKENNGVGGDDTGEILARLTSDVLADKNGGWAIVMAGTNDLYTASFDSDTEAAETSIANLTKIYKILKDAGMNVVAMTILPNSNYDSYKLRRERMNTINAWIKSVPDNVDIAIDTETPLRDVSDTTLLAAAYDYGDGVHLNISGAQALASLVDAAVTFGSTFSATANWYSDYAFTTISELNTIQDSGDTVYFECDNSFKGQVNFLSGCTYTYYGSGARPIIHSYVQKNSAGDWSDEGSNIWSIPSLTTEIANIVCNNTTALVRKWNTSSLTSQGDYYYSFAGDSLYVYSTSNPATYYSDVKLIENYRGFDGNDVSGSSVIGLEIAYTGNTGIYGDSFTNVTIENCKFLFNGGRWITGTTRMGNGVGTYGSMINVTANNNIFEKAYDTGFTPQYDGSGKTYQNIIFTNNIVIDNQYGFEWFNSTGTYTLDSILIRNNYFNGQGSGWGSVRSGTDRSSNITLWWVDYQDINEFYVYGNVFGDAGLAHVWQWYTNSVLTSDSNYYYNVSKYIYSSAGEPTTLEDYRTLVGTDANSQDIAADATYYDNNTTSTITAFNGYSGMLLDGTTFTNGVVLNAFDNAIVLTKSLNPSGDVIVGWKGIILGWKGKILGF